MSGTRIKAGYLGLPYQCTGLISAPENFSSVGKNFYNATPDLNMINPSKGKTKNDPISPI